MRVKTHLKIDSIKAAQTAQPGLHGSSNFAMSSNGPASPRIDFEIRVENTLQKLQNSVAEGFGNIGAQMPDAITAAVTTGLQQAITEMGLKPQMQGNSIRLDALTAENEELLAKNRSLMDRDVCQQQMVDLKRDKGNLINTKEFLERKVRDLNVDLQKKNQENRKLHGIIIESGQDETGISDETVGKSFGELSHEIMRLVRKHFGKTSSRLKWQYYCNLMADDRQFYLRAIIADKMHVRFFDQREGIIFGFGKSIERDQIALEKRLRERKVPEPDIVEWRMQTINVAKLLSSKERLHEVQKLSDDLCNELCHLRTAQSDDQWDATRREMHDLCEKGWELGLSLRACKARFKWSQRVLSASIDSSDVEMIGPFNNQGQSGPTRPVRNLFGPVYKIVDGDHILVRKGEVLSGFE